MTAQLASGRPPSVREDGRRAGRERAGRRVAVRPRTGDWRRGRRGQRHRCRWPTARACVGVRRRARSHVEVPGGRALSVAVVRARDGARGRGGGAATAGRCDGRRGDRRRTGDAARLDYEYAFDGDVDLLGVRFALPATRHHLEALARARARTASTGTAWTAACFDLHQAAYNDPVPGQSFAYPEFKGYFRDWHWLQLDTTLGTLTVENRSGVPFFGLYGPRDGEPPMLAFPDTGLALLHVIPAIGNKFDTPDQLGPAVADADGSGPARQRRPARAREIRRASVTRLGARRTRRLDAPSGGPIACQRSAYIRRGGVDGGPLRSAAFLSPRARHT